MAVQLPDEAALEEQLRQLSPREAVEYLNQLAELATQHYPALVRDLAQRAYERALHGGFRSGMAEAARLLGVAALFAGQYGQAQQWFAQALALFHELGDRAKVLHTLVNRAMAYHAVGEHALAVEELQQVLQQGVADFPSVHLKALQNLAIVLAELGQHDRALQIFTELITQAQQLREWQTLARAYNNAALLLARRGEYAQALAWQQESLRLKEQQGDVYGVAVAYGTLGYLYASMGRWQEAEAAYRRSLEMRKQLGDQRGRGYVLVNLGQLYRRQGLEEAAEEALSEAWSLAVELHERMLELEVARELSELSHRRGDTERALFLLRRCLELTEGLLSERIQRALVQVEARYELERQRREQEELRRLLVEWQYRALQAQMNPHFLFNVLTTVQYIVARGERTEAEQFIAEFAELVRRILRSAQRGLVPLREEVEIVELYLRIEQTRFRGAFISVIEVDPGLELDEIWIPPLLLQPLVENALKHGLAPRGGHGTVRVAIARDEGCVLCTIEDDGVGRRKSSHEGVGLRLATERLRLLSEHLGGLFGLRIMDRFDAEGRPAGTRVEVTIPQELDYTRAAQLQLFEPLGSVAKPVFSL